jgi:hypothetical protein
VSAEGLRARVDLGELKNPAAVQWQVVKQVADLPVRAAILGYLERPGVLLDRATPPGWFYWLDDVKRIFIARCADPPTEDSEHRDRPWNYFVEAEIAGGFHFWSKAHGAVATDFYHEARLRTPQPDA